MTLSTKFKRPADLHPSHNNTNPKLLIVDDEPEITNSLADLFRKEYPVLTAVNAAEALNYLLSEDIGVVIADQRMPDKTGVELFSDGRILKKDTVKILITGYTDIDAVIDAVNKGKVFFYLKKPWETHEIKQIVFSAFEHYKLIRERKKLIGDLQRINWELDARVKERTQELEKRTQELEKLNIRISELAYVDPLTNISNRRHLDETLSKEIERAEQREDPLSVLLIDIDNFKSINDTFSHIMGDKILIDVSSAVTGAIRKSDLIGRYGGDEFMLIMPGTNQSMALQIAERCRLQVEQMHLIGISPEERKNMQMDTVPQVTISIEVATRNQGQTSQQLIKIADEGLYKAKNFGRNQSAAVQYVSRMEAEA